MYVVVTGRVRYVMMCRVDMKRSLKYGENAHLGSTMVIQSFDLLKMHSV